MTRALVLGNGNIVVCIDQQGRIRDFYYPHVGQENHVQGNRHKTGVWADGELSWVLESPGWRGDLGYKKETMVSDVKAINDHLMVELEINEAVHHLYNIYLKKIVVKNLSGRDRKIKLFFNQHFHISEANVGGTVYYDPITKSIVDYKGKRYFLINSISDGKGFDDYATGVADEFGKVGTYVDAEDGELSKNSIEHGSVDSTISLELDVKGNESKTVYYWIAVGDRFNQVRQLNTIALKKGPEKLISESADFWNKWVNKEKFMFLGLDDKIKDMFKRSLLIVGSHIDFNGAIIASIDSDIMNFAKDTYNYMWPRDGALVARSLDKVGHTEITDKFFQFCSDVITTDGYLFPKYRPDASVGSSWHPWFKEGKMQLPIQEDETALVLDALWKHYDQYGHKKPIKDLYDPLIKRAGDFLASFRDKKTGLPAESYDLWEEKLGIHTFTCCTVYAGLNAASNFAKVFGSKKDVTKYSKAAEEIKSAILKHLYDGESKSFIKGIYYEKGKMLKDKTVDASTGYGLFEYKVLDVDDPMVQSTMQLIEERLLCKSHVGGIARYEGDNYYRVSHETVGNPWFIPTLWMAEYNVAKAKSKEDLKAAEDIFSWVSDNAMSTGVLSEQINPFNGDPISVSPLTWSHAAFVTAVIKYLDKLEDLGVCDPYVCYPSKKKTKKSK